MIRRADRGFTLIELLTVIAIIAILAAITFAAFPKIQEKARLRQLDGVFKQMQITLAQYYAEHQTYPPGYGFVTLDKGLDGQTGTIDDTRGRMLLPYTALLNIYDQQDLYDTFSEGYDGNNDNILQPMEYLPVAAIDPVTQRPSFPQTLYLQDAPVAGPYAEDEKSPLYYMPVNKDQLRRAAEYWRDPATGATAYPVDGTAAFVAGTWDPSDPRLSQLYDDEGNFLVPPRYDAYVLVSVGPARGTFGIVPASDPANVSRNDDSWYNIQALRGFFLATRDLNNDSAFDFDFDARRTGGPEAKGEVFQHAGTATRNWLPDPIAPQGFGPKIFDTQ
jgi:prepilin-type N-terminal cleavage/methylation domain-containing protein